jgi:hypothetical protein
MSYFPLLILLVDENRKMVVNDPKEIPSGKTFKVLKTNF